MLKFYLSFGRRRVPPYFAHDPLWRPVYPAWFLLIAVQVLSGMVLLHVLSVLLREARGKAYDISAMIQGHRIFRVDKTDVMGGRQDVTIAVQDILKSKTKGD